MKKKLTYLLSVLAIGLFIFLAYGSDDDGESSTVDLKASVSFNGTQFVIKNNDTFDYNNVSWGMHLTHIKKCSNFGGYENTRESN
ncbi:MAG: hypothetical protein RBR87_08910 [Bacteroidales bacterium]|jgi:hypothetical protein|nr:hypothetical protein [Bacteroidales bacterium]